MSVGISLLVIGAGALLTWAFGVHTAGVIVLLLGLAGLLVSLVLTFAHESWGESR